MCLIIGCWISCSIPSPLQNNISIEALSFSDDDDGDTHKYYNTEMKFVVNQLRRCIVGTNYYTSLRLIMIAIGGYYP